MLKILIINVFFVVLQLISWQEMAGILLILAGKTDKLEKVCDDFAWQKMDVLKGYSSQKSK